MSCDAWAQATPTGTIDPEAPLNVSGTSSFDPVEAIDNATKPEKLSSTLEIVIIMTVLSLVPAILVMTTCFTRIIVVLALLRQAIGTQQLPPSQVITGLALFMTFCVMGPTWKQINADAIQPYVDPPAGVAQIDRTEAFNRAKLHMRDFMIRQIENCGNSEDVYMFVQYGDVDVAIAEKIRMGTLNWEDVSMTALIPAFMTSELKQAFLMGFYIYLPFLVIDMVIASILMSMGMMMLPPVLISMPFKLLLFVLVNGWNLVVGTLMASFVNNPPI
ncbi:MAG: flagellar type III secretion system pore protein FliP [Phycisphaerae bacterium]|nr:flagellar type III secretion system pore protein FliP [Phycisphaerae bacterium]